MHEDARKVTHLRPTQKVTQMTDHIQFEGNIKWCHQVNFQKLVSITITITTAINNIIKTTSEFHCLKNET